MAEKYYVKLGTFNTQAKVKAAKKHNYMADLVSLVIAIMVGVPSAFGIAVANGVISYSTFVQMFAHF